MERSQTFLWALTRRSRYQGSHKYPDYSFLTVLKDKHCFDHDSNISRDPSDIPSHEITSFHISLLRKYNMHSEARADMTPWHPSYLLISRSFLTRLYYCMYIVCGMNVWSLYIPLRHSTVIMIHEKILGKMMTMSPLVEWCSHDWHAGFAGLVQVLPRTKPVS